MSIQLKIKQLEQAFSIQDYSLVQLIHTMSSQDDDTTKPVRAGALTFDDYLSCVKNRYKYNTEEERYQARVEIMNALEANDAEIQLSERLCLHKILISLWQSNDSYSRSCLLEVIPDIKLTYGPWRALKLIFKQAEAAHDTEMYGALLARFDQALDSRNHQVSQETLAYLCRRGWRYLRNIAETLPALYADAASDVLANYTGDAGLRETWVANHIFYHESGKYNRHKFTYSYSVSVQKDSMQKYRAYPDAWCRTPRPLFSLLERARSEKVRHFATMSLKKDFRVSLRDVEAQWVCRLVGRHSKTLDDFVIWILDYVPRFEQAAFRELGLHNSVLALFDSDSSDAIAYVVSYAKVHARDLPLEKLILLVDNNNVTVRKLAISLIQSRNPHTEVGLNAWGELLNTKYGESLAVESLGKYFGRKELTDDWFRDRLLIPSSGNCKFFINNLLEVHPYNTLGEAYFTSLLESLNIIEFYDEYDLYSSLLKTVNFLCNVLEKFDLNTLDVQFLQNMLCNPTLSDRVVTWIDKGQLNTSLFPVDFLKTLAYQPLWNNSEWIKSLKQAKPWAHDLEFDESLSPQVFEWLADIRSFSPAQLDVEWLLELVQRGEPEYHQFALNTLNKNFYPADFAFKPIADTSSDNSQPSVADFAGASFLFTGKLSKMTHSDSKKHVLSANGVNAAGVTKKLDYLVIGDLGLVANSKESKSTKQLKAEKLIASGANIRIISETLFLKMLNGDSVQSSGDNNVLEGCERLWSMVTVDGNDDAALLTFAISYIRSHHPGLYKAKTSKSLDLGAEIPDDFLNFDRVFPLFKDKRKPLRDLALDLASWEFARWKPTVQHLIHLSESPYSEVREFVNKALTVDNTPEHQRYRIALDRFPIESIYDFCESEKTSARKLGMLLIRQNPYLQIPGELFRLTESPDRIVRAFVIRTFWSWYRKREITTSWRPYVPVENLSDDNSDKKEKNDNNSDTKKSTVVENSVSAGSGAEIGVMQKPDQLPADFANLESFLRRILFEVPPGRSQKIRDKSNVITHQLKLLPARKAKLQLVETLQRIAIDDVDFAKVVLPLLHEFMGSSGKSERAVCLVAVTRIEHHHCL